MNLWIYLTLM